MPRSQAEVPGLQAPPASGGVRLSWRNPRPGCLPLGHRSETARRPPIRRFLPRPAHQSCRAHRAPTATSSSSGSTPTRPVPWSVRWDVLMGHSPGSVGHIHPGPVQAVTEWVDEAIINGDIVVFAGHHNWQSPGPAVAHAAAQPDGAAATTRWCTCRRTRTAGSGPMHRAIVAPAAAGTQRQLAVGLADRLPPHQLCLRRGATSACWCGAI